MIQKIYRWEWNFISMTIDGDTPPKSMLHYFLEIQTVANQFLEKLAFSGIRWDELLEGREIDDDRLWRSENLELEVIGGKYDFGENFVKICFSKIDTSSFDDLVFVFGYDQILKTFTLWSAEGRPIQLQRFAELIVRDFQNLVKIDYSNS